jgi:hypothetical protein
VRAVPGAVGSAPVKDPRKVFIGGKHRSGHGRQDTAARPHALLSSATPARAKQRGGVCFHRAYRVGPGPPSLSLWSWLAGVFSRALCQPRPRGAMPTLAPGPLSGLHGLAARRVARAPTRARAQQRADGLLSCRAHLFFKGDSFCQF